MTENNVIAPLQEHAAPAPASKSKGEKRFDQLVYGGLAGLGTLILTVPLAERLQHKWGWSQKLLAGMEKRTESLLSTFLSAEKSKKYAQDATSVTALMEGGNVMLLPVGILEHYKVPLVRAANESMGDTTPPEKIQETPKQTWMSLIQGRLSAWVLVFASLTAASSVFKKTFTTYVEECGELGAKLFKTTSHKQIFDEAGKLKTVETAPYKYGKIAALDLFATAAAATLLYVGGHFFARRHEQKKEHREAHVGVGKPLRDDTVEQVAEPVVLASSVPSVQVSGEKQAQGMLVQPQLQAIKA